MIKLNKRLLVHTFLAAITQLWTRKKHIVFYAPVKFHAVHLLPVINRMKDNPKVKISLVGDFDDFEAF